MLGKVNFQHAIKALYADRAYDRHKLYKLCKKYDIKAKILPKNRAAEHPKLWPREMPPLDYVEKIV